MTLPFAIGISLFSVGVATLIRWRDVVLPVFKGLAAFSLLFWGLIAIIVGYSEGKARREFAKALGDEPVDEA